MLNATIAFLLVFSGLYALLIVLAHRGRARHGGGLTEFFATSIPI